MKSKKKLILLWLVIPFVFASGVLTGILLQNLSNNILAGSTNPEISEQDEPHYNFEDFVLITNETYYDSQYPSIITGNCALIYSGTEENVENVSLYINGLFYSTGTSIKSITICLNPWLVYGGWFFGAWNTSLYDNGRYELTVYVDNQQVASTFVYIKN